MEHILKEAGRIKPIERPNFNIPEDVSNMTFYTWFQAQHTNSSTPHRSNQYHSNHWKIQEVEEKVSILQRVHTEDVEKLHGEKKTNTISTEFNKVQDKINTLKKRSKIQYTKGRWS